MATNKMCGWFDLSQLYGAWCHSKEILGMFGLLRYWLSTTPGPHGTAPGGGEEKAPTVGRVAPA